MILRFYKTCVKGFFLIFLCFLHDLFIVYFLFYKSVIVNEKKLYFSKVQIDWSGKYNQWSAFLRKLKFLRKLFIIKDTKRHGEAKFWSVFRHESVQFFLLQFRRVYFWWMYWCAIEGSWYEQDHDAKLRRHVYERDARRFIEVVGELA